MTDPPPEGEPHRPLPPLRDFGPAAGERAAVEESSTGASGSSQHERQRVDGCDIESVCMCVCVPV